MVEKSIDQPLAFLRDAINIESILLVPQPKVFSVVGDGILIDSVLADSSSEWESLKDHAK